MRLEASFVLDNDAASITSRMSFALTLDGVTTLKASAQPDLLSLLTLRALGQYADGD